MRVIGGRYRGHQLVNFKAEHIRPTTDRVKETIFNMLMNEIEESVVLDLFAGTGNLGIEALSRGAKEVTFVENNSKSLNIIQKNLDKLKIDRGYHTVSQEVQRFLQRSDKSFDIIFADPPFTKKMAHGVMERVSKSRVWNNKTVVVIESASSERIEDSYGSLFRFKNKDFGDKVLSMFRSSKTYDGSLECL